MKQLTSTSYAVLGLLAIKPWTSYELAKQVGRSLRFAWPRAEGRIYDEPKLLVAHGLATAQRQFTGRRARTEYTITPAGHTALAGWLAEPGAAPALEYEALLKVAFAESAGKAALVANLTAIRDHAAANLAIGRALGQERLDTGEPFPERALINGLVWNFLWSVHGSMHRWADWALAEVAGWPEDLAATPAARQRMLARFAEQLNPDTGRPPSPR